MLKPNWPSAQFQRTVTVGKKTRVLIFAANQPVEVSDAEMKALASDIGKAIVEVERDEKNRPRYVESEPEAPTNLTQGTPGEPGADREYKENVRDV